MPDRRTHTYNTPFAAALLTLCGTSRAAADDAPAQDVALRPFVHCVESAAGGQLRAHWGYFNRTKAPLSHPLGQRNRVTGTAEGEQPTQFQPGFVVHAFNSLFDAAQSSTWTLDGVSATADKGSHACSPEQRTPSRAELVNPAAGSGMFLGANFWSLKWQPANEYFLLQGNFSGAAPGPWQPQFLSELSPYRVLRFMDWNLTNDATNPQSSWSTRQPAGQAQRDAVAYEWQIDLCNRTLKDYWLTVPHAASPEYFGHVALLVREKLDPRLRVYVEWSNEVWNGSFPQHGYARAKGTQLKLPGKDPGMSYQVYQSVRLFEAFERVFGKNNPRVVKVLAGQAAWDGPCTAQLAALQDLKVNPKLTRADVYAIAPYVYGNSIDELRGVGMTQAKEWVADALRCAQNANLPLIAYEGGQDSFGLGQTGCERLQRDPGMRVLYATMPDVLAAAGMRGPFVHYTHSGVCWGLKVHNGDSPATSPKYQGLVDWATKAQMPPR
jgi:hypothetical protein